MTDPRSLPERLMGAIDSHRWEEVDPLVHPDAEVNTPFAAALQPAAWVELNRAFAVGVPDGAHTLTSVVQDGDRFAVEGRWTGTHTGPLATPGGEVPATGRAVVLPFCAVGEQRDGRLAAMTVHFDRLAMLAQLGLVPEPAATH